MGPEFNFLPDAEPLHYFRLFFIEGLLNNITKTVRTASFFWGGGLCPSSGILNNTAFQKLDQEAPTLLGWARKPGEKHIFIVKHVRSTFILVE
jgi:hypothetical protein